MLEWKGAGALRIEEVDVWRWNSSLQLEVENIKMLSQLVQVCRLIQTQFQYKHVCTQHTQGNGSLLWNGFSAALAGTESYKTHCTQLKVWCYNQARAPYHLLILKHTSVTPKVELPCTQRQKAKFSEYWSDPGLHHMLWISTYTSKELSLPLRHSWYKRIDCLITTIKIKYKRA